MTLADGLSDCHYAAAVPKDHLGGDTMSSHGVQRSAVSRRRLFASRPRCGQPEQSLSPVYRAQR